MAAGLIANWILVEERAARFGCGASNDWIVIFQVRHGTVPHKFVEDMACKVKLSQSLQGKSNDIGILLCRRHLGRGDLVTGA